MLVGLVGNPNSGKTTLFNRLCKTKQKVGNFPGVTVEAKKARLNQDVTIIDLPGTYSLNQVSSDEKITNHIIESNEIDLIVNVIDVNALRRSLYLTFELLELNKPLAIVLNMIDEFHASNNEINVNKMSEILGCKVISISANKRINLDELEDYLKNFKIKDHKERLPLIEENKNPLSRYQAIDRVINSFYLKPLKPNKKIKKSLEIDRFLLNKYLAYPIFAFIMFLVFFITFGPLGKGVNEIFSFLLDSVLLKIEEVLIRANTNEVLLSLISEGIFIGLGAVISFMPSILLLFFLLSLLEDSGYLTRIALLMDKPLRKLNLTGKAFVPLLLGFGCTVPAVLASKTLNSEQEKKRVIFSTSFMSCSAKVPIYMMVSGLFFKKNTYVVCMLLYLIGILFSLIVLSFSKKKSKKSDFILEIPPYRFPSLSNCLILMANKCKEFFKKTFSIIFLCSLLIWFLTHFDNRLTLTNNINSSLLADFSRLISFIFTPLGFNDWRISASLISGISAKESFVSTIGILFNGDNISLLEVLTPLKAFSLLIFILFYTPCFAAQASISKELNSKWKGILVGFLHFILAYVLALFTYQIGMIFL